MTLFKVRNSGCRLHFHFMPGNNQAPHPHFRTSQMIFGLSLTRTYASSSFFLLFHLIESIRSASLIIFLQLPLLACRLCLTTSFLGRCLLWCRGSNFSFLPKPRNLTVLVAKAMPLQDVTKFAVSTYRQCRTLVGLDFSYALLR